jgi:hypothetical protein
MKLKKPSIYQLSKTPKPQCNLPKLLALDYLLASEGGVCGKFNLSNCCLQTDDTGKVTEEITDRMRKIAHVPVQTWKGWDPEDLLGGWFFTIGGHKTMFGAVLIIVLGCLIVPCATGHVVHIDPDRSHTGTENSHRILSTTRLPKSKSHP